MFQKRLIYEEESFTASLPLEALTAGRYIHKLSIALKGEMTAAAAVAAGTFADVLNPFEVRLLGSPVIYIRGSGLLALNILGFGKVPLTLKAGAATDNRVRLYGLEVPIQQPARPSGALAIKCNYMSISGVDTETITISELSSDVTIKPKYYHYVEIPYTLAAAIGYGNFIDLPQPGELHGILFYSTTIPTVTSDTVSIEKVMVVIGGSRAFETHWFELKANSKIGSGIPGFEDPGDVSFIDNYAYLDLSEDPIPPAETVTLDIYAGVAGDSIRVIPIYLI